MDETGKGALAFGAGVLIGKVGGNAAWWLLGGAVAIAIMHSPTAKTALSKAGAQVKKKIGY